MIRPPDFVIGPPDRPYLLRWWIIPCPKGWVPWYEFVDETNHGNVGRGCGEKS